LGSLALRIEMVQRQARSVPSVGIARSAWVLLRRSDVINGNDGHRILFRDRDQIVVHKPISLCGVHTHGLDKATTSFQDVNFSEDENINLETTYSKNDRHTYTLFAQHEQTRTFCW
jgi:hypothetical protein